MKKTIIILLLTSVSYFASSQAILDVYVKGGAIIDTAKLVHKAGAETITGVKTFTSTTLLNGQVGIGTTTPAAGALLDISSTSTGVLLPRMTQAQMLLISSPPNGLMIINTDSLNRIFIYNGASWRGLTYTNEGGGGGGGSSTDTSLLVHKANTETITGVKTFSANTFINGQMGIGTSTTNGIVSIYSPSTSGVANILTLTNPYPIGTGVGTAGAALNFGRTSPTFAQMGQISVSNDNETTLNGGIMNFNIRKSGSLFNMLSLNYGSASVNGALNTLGLITGGTDISNSGNHMLVSTSTANSQQFGTYFQNNGNFNLFNINAASIVAETGAPWYAKTDLVFKANASGDITSNNAVEVMRNTNNGLTIGSTALSNSAILAATSTTRGVLFPRMTNAQMTAIASPATGLMVTNTDSLSRIFIYNGTTWRGLSFTNEGGGGSSTDTSLLVHKANAETITGAKTFSANAIFNSNVGLGMTPGYKLDVNGDIQAVTNYRSSSNNIVLTDAAGPVFRGVRANAWADNASSRFFQIGGYNDNVVVTTQSGTSANRLLLTAASTQVSSGTYSTNNIPTGVFEVSNGASGLLNVTTSGNVGIGNPTPAASTALDITSTTRGVLLPRVTTTQMNAIASPATGLMVTNTDSSNKIFIYSGGWKGLAFTSDLTTAISAQPKVYIANDATNYLQIFSGTSDSIGGVTAAANLVLRSGNAGGKAGMSALTVADIPIGYGLTGTSTVILDTSIAITKAGNQNISGQKRFQDTLILAQKPIRIETTAGSAVSLLDTRSTGVSYPWLTITGTSSGSQIAMGANNSSSAADMLKITADYTPSIWTGTYRPLVVDVYDYLKLRGNRTATGDTAISFVTGGNLFNYVGWFGNAGKLHLPKYGAGSFTGTPVYNLGVTATGDVVEVGGGSGTATLVSGTVTVSTTAVNAGSQIWVQYSRGVTTTASILTTPTVTAGTSFVITAITPGAATTATTDNNIVKWWIMN